MDETTFDFIERNHEALVSYIMQECPNCSIDTQDDIEEWIMNDEYLYQWAESEGVQLL